MSYRAESTQAAWQNALISSQAKAVELFSRSEERQKELGYFHTLQEICQQPWTWLRTCERMVASRKLLQESVADVRCIAFTGSGSSLFAGHGVCLPVQFELGISVESIAGGDLLTQGVRALPPWRPGLLVSLSRSGDSPESGGAIKLLLDADRQYRHLVLTCNEQGSLAKDWNGHGQVSVITLPPETNDQSLVMTSSFTNLLLAARILGMLGRPSEYLKLCGRLSAVVQELILHHFDAIAGIASTDFQRAVFLGTGTRYAAAREATLKMLEMTSGRVTTMCETYLGLRHGPMSFVHDDTLIVAHLSSEASARAYEVDLLKELDRKRLGLRKLLIGNHVPKEVVRNGDVLVTSSGSLKLRDDDLAIAYVVVGQLLAFFRCLREGLQPDSPSESGVIQRVVENFPLHTSRSESAIRQMRSIPNRETLSPG